MMNDKTKWQGFRVFGDDKENKASNDALIWFTYWRPPIETLMNGSTDNCLVALQLMYPCMERVYQLKEGKVGKKGLTKEVLKHFFPREDDLNEENYNRIISKVTKEMRHGLAHDAFVRDGVEIWDGLVRYFDSGLSLESPIEAFVFADLRGSIFQTVDDKVVVNVRSFWRVVKSKVDGFYTSRDYLLNHVKDDINVILHAAINYDRGRTTQSILKGLQEAGLLKSNGQ